MLLRGRWFSSCRYLLGMSLKPIQDVLNWRTQHHCPKCGSSSRQWIKFGAYLRRSDQQFIQRYRCRLCSKHFSAAKFDLCWHQRKRQINPMVFNLLVSGVSQRRAARILLSNRKTIVRKFIFLGGLSLDVLKLQNSIPPKSTEVQFDELETIEHTKCKPVSVLLAVDQSQRRILEFQVARMPAKGPLAEFSRKKYGPRIDERQAARMQFFENLREYAHEQCLFKSDDSPLYRKDLKKYFPKAKHKRFESRRSSVGGQGELKKTGFDPLFSINHTFAKMRADINRLFRKTWCTTKSVERLRLHIAMMALHHNASLEG